MALRPAARQDVGEDRGAVNGASRAAYEKRQAEEAFMKKEAEAEEEAKKQGHVSPGEKIKRALGI
jgi:hypothetical protein